jgi:Zn-dependent protease
MMRDGVSSGWSLPIGRWRTVEIRLHLAFPILALSALLLSSLSPGRLWGFGTAPASSIGWALLVLLVSVACHEAVKALAAFRVGGSVTHVVLAPWGGGAPAQLPADPPAHLVTAFAGPLVYVSLATVAGCVLVLAGERNLVGLVDLFNPAASVARAESPEGAVPAQGKAELTGSLGLDLAQSLRGADGTTAYESLGLLSSRLVEAEPTARFLLQLFVWINAWLLLVSLLPIAPLDGQQALCGMLWPMVGRATASAATASFALGASAVCALLALVVQDKAVNDFIPAWYPLSIASVMLLYGAAKNPRRSPWDDLQALDRFDSDDELWIAGEWLDDDRAPVLVERQEERQQESVDRKRREREDREDARVDDILARVQQFGLDQLTDEERAVLKRASRRYRRRRGQSSDS